MEGHVKSGGLPRVQEVKGIVLDFDGVILESNHVKAESFRLLFSKHPQHGDRIVQLHRDHGGMPRFQKLRIICRDIIGDPVDDAGIAELSREFGKLAEKRLLSCPYTPGALEFLKAYSAGWDLFIASGTPEDEMQDLTARLGISGFFKGVYGSPRDKGEILRDVLAVNRWEPRQLVFVGDSADDFKGAEETSVPFIARVGSGQRNSFDEKKVALMVSDLGDLARRWRGG